MNTDLRMALVRAQEWTGTNDSKRYRREEWSITGGEIDPAWKRVIDVEPSSRFTLYIVDDEVDVRLSSYGGVVWPTAWPSLFQAKRQDTYQATVEITDKGLRCRAAALHGASDMCANVRLS